MKAAIVREANACSNAGEIVEGDLEALRKKRTEARPEILIAVQ